MVSARELCRLRGSKCGFFLGDSGIVGLGSGGWPVVGASPDAISTLVGRNGKRQRSADSRRHTSRTCEVLIPLPTVEVGIGHTLPAWGSNTSQMKVFEERLSAHLLWLQLSAPANTIESLMLRQNDPKLHFRVDGAEISSDSGELLVRFPPGTGYREKGVSFSW
jgi:hypothetical protein